MDQAQTTTAGCRYEELAHTSEVGIRVYAEDGGALYACAAVAMFALLQTQPQDVDEITEHAIHLTSADAESLMVDWLSELLYLHETTGQLMSSCAVTAWAPERISANVLFCRPRQHPTMHIKAVTYHQLVIVQLGGEWCAEVYFDI